MNTTKYSGLYPSIEPYETGMLRVSDTHELYYELCGNSSAPTVVFLHGGPGGCIRPDHRRFFDPEAYRICLYDQRGCGKSRPHASLVENTTQALVADLELLREHIEAERWGVFGGSWGSTLALAYAQEHAQRATFLVLRGIFLGRQSEVDWLYERHGAAQLFPHAFDAYIGGLPEHMRDCDSILHTFYKVITGPPSEARSNAARAFCNWEGALSYFPGRPVTRADARATVSNDAEPSEAAVAISTLESHYFVNKCFFERDGLLLDDERLNRVRHIPTAIVQGRFDFVCPVRSAYELANAWPQASFEVIENAGHSAFEDGTRQALRRITDSYRDLAHQ